MMRFIDLTGQIDDEFQFAWFNTVFDKFLEYNDCQAWSSWEEFEEDFKSEVIVDPSFIERLKSLFPRKKYKKQYLNEPLTIYLKKKQFK